MRSSIASYQSELSVQQSQDPADTIGPSGFVGKRSKDPFLIQRTQNINVRFVTTTPSFTVKAQKKEREGTYAISQRIVCTRTSEQHDKHHDSTNQRTDYCRLVHPIDNFGAKDDHEQTLGRNANVHEEGNPVLGLVVRMEKRDACLDVGSH